MIASLTSLHLLNLKRVFLKLNQNFQGKLSFFVESLNQVFLLSFRMEHNETDSFNNKNVFI